MTESILTGSRVYGPYHNNERDIDIVLKKEDARALRDYLGKKGIEWDFVETDKLYTGESYYFSLVGVKFNIIEVIDDDDFTRWKSTTEQMLSKDIIEDRQERIATFRELFGEEET